MVRTGALILVSLLLAPTWSGEASDKTVLIELEPGSAALPSSVSACGAVVVGSLGVGGFYWMPATGVIYAGGTVATRVSRDGKVIVGQAADARGIQQAAIWQRGTEWRLLGSFPNALPCDAALSLANDTSRDGKVVVGYARNGCTGASLTPPSPNPSTTIDEPYTRTAASYASTTSGSPGANAIARL